MLYQSVPLLVSRAQFIAAEIYIRSQLSKVGALLLHSTSFNV
jgi:hypothetical protein